jgi:L-ascorbate oxidase
LNNTLFEWLNEPNNLLVNGNALGMCNSTALTPGQTCNGVTCGNNLQLIKPGKRYKVRVIASGVLSYVSLALEGHSMTLFEADVKCF